MGHGRVVIAVALTASALMSAVIFSGCAARAVPISTPSTQATTLRLYATTATIPLINDLTLAYSRLNPTLSFEIATGSYSSMVERLASGETPYFLSSTLAPDSQQDPPLWAAPIGQDGLAMIVNAQNDIATLTRAQVADIMQGWVNNWQQVGGRDLPITVFSREQGSGTRMEFESLLMGTRAVSPSALIVPSSAAMLESVAREIGGIGYLSMSYLNPTVRAVPIDGVPLTPANVAANLYPLRSILYAIGMREPDGSQPLDLDYRAFFAWVQSPEGQAVVARHYAPLNP
jgi:phosphate transport system substrate-binding protein